MKKTNELNKQKTVENLVGATIGRPLLQRLGPNKGITLVALIITIVIMLILATVTVNVVIDGGLFEYAGNAKDSVEVANEKETIQKAFIFAESASKTGRITKTEIQKAINKVASENNVNVYDFDEDFIIIFGTKRAYTIDKKGKILGMEENYKSPNKTFLAQVRDSSYGTAEKPYEIKCIEDLVDLSFAVNGIEVLENGTLSYTGTVNRFERKKY